MLQNNLFDISYINLVNKSNINKSVSSQNKLSSRHSTSHRSFTNNNTDLDKASSNAYICKRLVKLPWKAEFGFVKFSSYNFCYLKVYI